MADGPENQSSTAEQKEHQSPSSSSSSAYPETEKLKKQIEAPFGGFRPADGDIQMIPSMSPAIFQGTFGAFRLANGDIQMIPIMSPGIFQPQLNQEQVNHGRGIYAVGTDSLIPFTYSLPTQSAPDSRPVVGGDPGQLDPQQQQQQQQQPHQQNAGAQRQVVVRRFQIAFQLDLLLILKLAAVIFLFNPDGSRQRLVLLVFFAVLVYLYQTGALTPLVRWLSQGMQRAAMPPPRQPPPRPAVRADNNDHAAGRAGNENAAAAAADGQPGAEAAAAADGGDRAVENEGLAEPGGAPPEVGRNRWWGIIKEIQIIVFGFITSLLPGFHNIEQ